MTTGKSEYEALVRLKDWSKELPRQGLITMVMVLRCPISPVRRKEYTLSWMWLDFHWLWLCISLDTWFDFSRLKGESQCETALSKCIIMPPCTNSTTKKRKHGSLYSAFYVISKIMRRGFMCMKARTSAWTGKSGAYWAP